MTAGTRAPRHGTYARYYSRAYRCRCDACREAKARYEKWRKVTGAASLVDSTPVLRHLAVLKDAGLGARRIATVSGVNRATVQRLLAERPPRLQRLVAARLLTVTVDDVSARVTVDATGTRRRLQGLVALGWTQKDLAQRIGWHGPNLAPVIHGRPGDRVAHSTARAVAAVYDELSMTAGGSPVAVRVAARHDWSPPLCWDDDAIDDPAASPAERRTDRRRSRAEVIEDFLDTLDHHLGEIQVAADRLGVTPGSLERTLYRAKADGMDIRFHGSPTAIAS